MGAKILNAEQIAADMSASLRALAKLTGFSERTVTLAECGVILKTCVGRTKVATPEKIGVRVRLKTSRLFELSGKGKGEGVHQFSVNAGRRGPRGRMWRHTINGKFQLVGQFSDDAQTFRQTRYHLKPIDQMDLKESVFGYSTEIKRKMPLALKSASLARQSWVQIADDLGIALETIPGGGASPAAIAKARAAIASNGQSYTNGIGTAEFEANKKFLARLTNQLPYWPSIQLDTLLLSVIQGRTKFFQQNVARAVLASHAQTVKAYPWIKLLAG
jgi:hypothetical protein